MYKYNLSQHIDALASSRKWISGHLHQIDMCPFPFLLAFDLERFLPSISFHFETFAFVCTHAIFLYFSQFLSSNLFWKDGSKKNWRTSI